jgi:ABC-type multidrug transport system fused ATPase/permease subunit
MGILRAVFQIVPLAFVLVWLEPKLAAISTVVLLVFAAVLRGLRRRVATLQKSSLSSTEELAAAADDAIRNADVWRVFGAEEKAKTRVKAIGDAIGRRSARLAAITSAMSGANEVLAGIVLLALVGAAHAGWLGGVRIERLLPFVVTFFLAYRPLRDFTEAQLALGRARAAWGSIGELLEHSEDAAADEHEEFTLARLDVDLVLPLGTDRPIAFSLAPGEVLVVRGPTGIGKTTLLRVLLGLEAQASGSIRWDGVELPQASGSARPFAWVPQDASILADSLDANVRLAADRADARAVLESIGAEHLGERSDARKVSGGERQLIALARALAADRPVLLLDEPTSGLDDEAQSIVLRAIECLRGKRTIVIVTHRPEPLALADVVVDLGATVSERSLRAVG